MDDSKLEEVAANGCDDIPVKRTKRQFPVDLPLDVVLGKMPQKVNCKVMLILVFLSHDYCLPNLIAETSVSQNIEEILILYIMVDVYFYIKTGKMRIV